MVNKDQTINNAIRKYHTVYPIRGKHSLDDCFFFLRGVAYFQFVTSDKKIHTMEACLMKRCPVEACPVKTGVSRPVTRAVCINREMVTNIIEFVNRPILLRRLIFRRNQKYTGISALCNGSELQRLLQA